MLGFIELCQDTDRHTVIKARDLSKHAFRFTVGIFVANKLALEAGIGCRLLLKHPAVVWLIRHVAWLITRYNTGRDGCSPSGGSLESPTTAASANLCEQVHYKLSGHPSSRVEPRWELGAWVGKTELTDEHLLGTLSGIRNSRTIYRLPKSHCYSKDALDRIVGTPANPKPEGAAKDPQIRRQYITQRWVDEAWCYSRLSTL